MTKTLGMLAGVDGRWRRMRHSQCAQGKDGHQGDLLSAGNLEVLEDRHRVDQDEDVGKDVDGRVGEPEGLLVQTKALDRVIPEFREREAVQPGAEDGPCAVHAEEADQAPTSESHAWSREDTLVLEEDGGFGHDQSRLIDGDRRPEILDARCQRESSHTGMIFRAPSFVLHRRHEGSYRDAHP